MAKDKKPKPSAWARLAKVIRSEQEKNRWRQAREHAVQIALEGQKMEAEYFESLGLGHLSDTSFDEWTGYGRGLGLNLDGLTLGEVKDAVVGKLKLERMVAQVHAQVEAEAHATMAHSGGFGDADGPQYVTLEQIAILAGQKKDTLRRKKNAKGSTFPAPDVDANARGKAELWLWATIRPWLAEQYPGRRFPSRYPEWR